MSPSKSLHQWQHRGQSLLPQKWMQKKQKHWLRFHWSPASPISKGYTYAPPTQYSDFQPKVFISIIHSEWNKKEGKNFLQRTFFVILFYPEETNENTMNQERRDSVGQSGPWDMLSPVWFISEWFSMSGMHLNDRHAQIRHLINASWMRMNLRSFIIII